MPIRGRVHARYRTTSISSLNDAIERINSLEEIYQSEFVSVPFFRSVRN
jgi:hypothetical protein